MILATHNSLSSYAPKRWWMRLLNPFARCQSLSIEEQYERGVRMFDIRVRPHTGEAAHGLVTYNVKIKNILTWLNLKAFGHGEHIYIRLCCENNNSPLRELDDEWFSQYWGDCIEKFKYLTFCGGYMKKGWRKLIYVRDPEYLELYRTFNVYKAMSGWKNKLRSIWEYICNPTPKYWAKKDNAKYIEENKDYQDYIMLDFVEYGKYM